VEQILQAGLYAASGHNHQVPRFIALKCRMSNKIKANAGMLLGQPPYGFNFLEETS